MSTSYIHYPTTGGGGGTTIGDPVVGGSVNEVLYVDSSGNLADSSAFKYNGSGIITLTGSATIQTMAGTDLALKADHVNIGDFGGAGVKSFLNFTNSEGAEITFLGATQLRLNGAGGGNIQLHQNVIANPVAPGAKFFGAIANGSDMECYPFKHCAWAGGMLLGYNGDVVSQPAAGEIKVKPGTNLALTADKVLCSAGIGVGNSAAATVPGTVVKKIEVFDAAGASLGFIAVFDAIT